MRMKPIVVEPSSIPQLEEYLDIYIRLHIRDSLSMAKLYCDNLAYMNVHKDMPYLREQYGYYIIRLAQHKLNGDRQKMALHQATLNAQGIRKNFLKNLTNVVGEIQDCSSLKITIKGGLKGNIKGSKGIAEVTTAYTTNNYRSHHRLKVKKYY